MGMYNEVYKSCPKCRDLCEIQIRQIVLGFGSFNLDNIESLADELTEEQLLQLRDAVKDERFYCRTCGCSFTFDSPNGKRRQLAKELFDSTETDCPCCGYPNCGHHHSEPDLEEKSSE